MTSTLLIKDIEIGKVDVDYMSGIMTPLLQTFIKGDNYTLKMSGYHYNYNANLFRVSYLLSQYDNGCIDTQTEFDFYSTKIDINNQNEFYQLDEIKEDVSEETNNQDDISLELIDEIMDAYWNDDTGTFTCFGIEGTWEVIDVKYERDEVEQYIFNLKITNLEGKVVDKSYRYIINPLDSKNELIEL